MTSHCDENNFVKWRREKTLLCKILLEIPLHLHTKVYENIIESENLKINELQCDFRRHGCVVPDHVYST